MAWPASSMSRRLQRRAKLTQPRHRAGSKRGLIESGELRLKQRLERLAHGPGPASGRTWLGQTKPQLACEQPLPKPPAVEDRDRPAGVGQVVGAGRADDAAADDDDRSVPTHAADAHAERVVRIEHQRRLGGDVGRAGDARDDLAVHDRAPCPRRRCRRCSPAARPRLAQLAVGDEAGELGAGAGAARRAVVGLAGTEDEVAAVGCRDRAAGRTARCGRSPRRPRR